MHRDRGWRVGRTGQVQVHGDVRHRRYGQADGVAVHDRVRGNRDRPFAAKGQRAARRALNGARFIAERNMCGADGDRCGSVRVAEHDARLRSASAAVDNLAERLIREVDVRRRRECLTGRRGNWRRGRSRTPGVGDEGCRPWRRRCRVLRASDFGSRPGCHPAIGRSET